MTTTLLARPQRELIPNLWRDPHTVPPEQRIACIRQLEAACAAHPESADLQALLGVAYAVNFDVYKSLDALDAATGLDPRHFFAQVKLGELWYRLRALPKAEEETLKAVQLATSAVELQLARRQLQEIRRLMHNSFARPTWGKSLVPGAAFLATLAVVAAMAAIWQ